MDKNNTYTRCNYCGIVLKYQKNYKSHIREVHLKIKYECYKCKKSYTKKSNLKRHKCENKTLHICGGCGIGFSRLDTMKKHRQLHEKKNSKKDNTKIN